MPVVIELAKTYGPGLTSLAVIVTFLLRLGDRLSRVEQQCASLSKGLDNERVERKEQNHELNSRITDLGQRLLALESTVHQLAASVAEIKGYVTAMGRGMTK